MNNATGDRFDIPVDRFFESIEERLTDIFRRYREGGEVPTGERLRLEGFMEAGIFLGIAGRDELLERMDIIYRDILGESLPRSCYDIESPPVTIPARWPRAPVYPSTRQ